MGRVRLPKQSDDEPEQVNLHSTHVHPRGTDMYTLGFDVHKRYSQIAVINEDGKPVDEVRVENANLEEIAQKYDGCKAVMEATGNYFTIYDRLAEHLDIVVAHPGKTKAIGAARVKNDRLDAKLLAQLRSAGMIAQSYVPPDEIRKRRALTRGRKKFVDKRKDFKNEVHSLLDQHGIAFEGTLFSKAGREFLAELSLDGPAQLVLEGSLRMIETFDEQIKRFDTEIAQHAASLPETQLLMTIPGVSFYSSLLITAELGEIDRFEEAKQAVSYAGLDPTVRESGDSRTEGHISKHGNANLRWILVQCANTAIRYDDYFGRFYHRLKRRKNHKKAIVATARKLLVSIFHMLTRKEVYNPPGVAT